MAQKILMKRGARMKLTQRERFFRLLELAIRFALSFTLSGASLFGAISPFAVGMAACSGAGLSGFAAILGAAVGYLIFCPLTWALKYICVCILIAIAAVILRDVDIYYSAWFMPVVAFGAAALVAAVTYAGGGWSLSEIVYTLCDGIIAGGCAFFFTTALSPWTGQLNFERGEQIAHTVSVLLLLATLLVSLSGVTLFGVISIGRTFAALVVFFAAYSGGVGMGCATGITMGLAMDAASVASPPIFGLAYGHAGLVAGIFARRSRFVFAVVFVVVDAAAAVMAFGSDAVPAILYEVFIASVVFMVAPPTFLHRLQALIPEKSRNAGAARAREYTKNRVELASLAFRELYDATTSETVEAADTEDAFIVFKRAAENVCRTCTRSAECWQADYQSTADVMNNVTAQMLDRGALDNDDFPDYFIDACLHPAEFVGTVNTEARALLYRRRLNSRLRGSRSIAYNQFSEMSDILSGVANELGSGLGFEPELETKMRRYLQSHGILADVGVFRDKGGRLHAEVTGELGALRRDDQLLDKLSAALGVRLCAPEGRIPANRLELLEAEPLAARIGMARMNKAGESVSGDKGAFFKTDEGMLYVLLSDGMGSGENAARMSGETVRIIERFLRSGVAPITAVRMLNDIMLLRGDEGTISATVDLAEVNLFTGDITLYKYGAAPSYVKSDHVVRRVRGRSFAAGLGSRDENEPDIARLNVRPGGIAVVVSDGVLGGGGNDRDLMSLISEFESDGEPDALARAIVESARALGKTDDDVTAIAIRIHERT